jgi:serine/threonine protein kinase
MSTALRDSRDVEFVDQMYAGATSAIHTCVDRRGHRYIAKIFPKNKSGKVYYERESSLLKKLRGPHVVRLVDAFETIDSYVLIMKNGGTDLYNFVLNNALLCEDTITKLAFGMFKAVADVHGRNVVHGDVKLENVVIDSKRRVRLIDFGLSTEKPVNGRLTRLAGGTRFYRAPELIAGEAYDHKVDVWALGITLCVLATRTFPFTVEDEYWNSCAVLSEEPDLEPLSKRYSPAFVDLVRAMLDKNSGRRPSIEQCLAFPFFKQDPAHT